MTNVSAALQALRKPESDTQTVLQLVQTLKLSEKNVAQLLTLSPSCTEVFSWWEAAPGGQPSQSAACFNVLIAIIKSVLKSNQSFLAQAVAVSRKLLKERLHSVYGALGRYSAVNIQRSCLELLGLMNLLDPSLTKILLDDFNFAHPSLKEMLAKNGSLHLDAIRFLLSFLCSESSDAKSKFMSINHIIKTMLQKIENDNDTIRIEIVDILSEHVLSDIKILKKIKSKFFNTGSLLKLSKFLESSNEDLKEKTGLLFTKLCTDTKYGILYQPSSVFVEISTNPTLSQFIRQANLVTIPSLVSTLSNAAPDLFLVALENLTLLAKQKESTASALGAMIELYQSRTNDVLQTFITPEITDVQIAKSIAPKLVTDLIDVSLKSSDPEVVINARLLLTALVKDVASIVTSQPARTNLPEIILFYLPDCSIEGLNVNMATSYLKIDQRCLVRSSVKVALFCPSAEHLTVQDVEMLMLLPMNGLYEFVKDNHELIVKSCSTIGDKLEPLMRRFLSSTGVFVGTEIDYVCNVFRVETAELPNFLVTVFAIIFKDFDDLSSEVSKFYQGVKKYSNDNNISGCPDSLRSILNEYNLFDSVTDSPDQAITIPEYENFDFAKLSPEFVVKYFHRLGHSQRSLWHLASCRREDELASLLVQIFAFDEKYKLDTSLESPHRRILSDICVSLAKTEFVKSDTFEATFRTILTNLISVNYQFSVEEMVAACLLDVGVELFDSMVVKPCDVDPDDLEEHRDTIYQLGVMFPDRCFAKNITKYFKWEYSDPEACIKVTKSRMLQKNVEMKTLFMLLTGMYVSCSEVLRMHYVFNKLEVFAKLDVSLQEKLFKEIVDNPEHTLDDDQYGQIVVYIFNILQSKSPERVYDTDYTIMEYVSDPLIKQQALAVLCHSLNDAQTATLICNSAMELGFFEVFYEAQYEKTLDFFGGMKSKKWLKEVLEKMTESDEAKHLTNFISKHYKAYEETVPLFTTKTIKKLVSKCIKTPTSPSLDSLKDFIIVFQSLLKEALLCDIFSSMLQTPDLLTHLGAEESDVKTSFISLFSAMIDIVQIPDALLTPQCYTMFQAAYTASSTETDAKVLKILKYFETKDVMSKFPFAYGSHVPNAALCKNIDAYNEQCISIIESLDPVKLQSLIDNFPLHSSESGKVSALLTQEQYSSEFLLSMISYILHHGGLDVKSFLSSPIVHIPLLAISSYDETTRYMGYSILEKFLYMTDEDTFREKSFCNLILSMLRRSVTEPNQRVPHMITYFIGKFILAMFKPQAQQYEPICHFLLQRPVFDFFDVPMFYAMFCNSNQFYFENQNWLLKILIPAIKDDVDFSILARRHVLPLCISQLSCGLCEKMTGKLIKALFVKVNTVASAKVREQLNEICVISQLMK